VNDEFGHLIGDEVLLLFSQMMTKSFRETDPLFRFGGEEFVGIFGCAEDSDITAVLKRFTDKLQTFSFPQVGKVTASVGFTKLTDDSAPSQLVDRADLALYYAKIMVGIAPVVTTSSRRKVCCKKILKKAKSSCSSTSVQTNASHSMSGV